MSTERAAVAGLPPLPPSQRDALDAFVSLAYEDLRTLAARLLRRGYAGSILPPAALVHETYIRLASPAGRLARPRALPCHRDANDAAGPRR